MLSLPKHVAIWHCSPPHAPTWVQGRAIDINLCQLTGVSLHFWLHMVDIAPTVLQWPIVGVAINMISFDAHKCLVYLNMYVHVHNIQKYFIVFTLSYKSLIYMYMNVFDALWTGRSPHDIIYTFNL